MSFWNDIKPKGIASKEWRFAIYSEFASERTDKQSFYAFLFRNDDRTRFGIREWVGDCPHHQDIRLMATKVVTDPEFRKSLLSDRDDLPKWWKRH